MRCYSLLQECLQDVNLKLQGVYALFSCVHTCWAIVQWGVSVSKKQSWAFTGRHSYNGCHLFWRLALFIRLSGTAEDIIPTHNKWKFRASSSPASSMLPGWITHTGFTWWKEHSNSYNRFYEDLMTQTTRIGFSFAFFLGRSLLPTLKVSA